jgi:hypothetical protein
MTRWILIALLVPAVALGGPKKTGKGGKKAKPEETDKAATDPAPTPTGAGAGSGAAPPSTTLNAPQAGQTPPAGAGSGAPAPQPQPPPQPTGDKPPEGDGGTKPDDAKGPDIDALRQEYLSLRDELFKSRARANAVAGQLYSTRMTIKFTWGSGRYYGVNKASIRLDGATVYEDATGAIATDDGVRFDGYVAPGRHLITFRVEATGKDDDSFTSATETQIVVKAVGSKDLVVAAKGKDSGDIAYEWKKSEKGSYGLGIDVSVKSVGQGGAPKGKK